MWKEIEKTIVVVVIICLCIIMLYDGKRMSSLEKRVANLCKDVNDLQLDLAGTNDKLTIAVDDPNGSTTLLVTNPVCIRFKRTPDGCGVFYYAYPEGME